MTIWGWNRKYIDAVNSCSNAQLFVFFDELIDDGSKKTFTSKWFLWNLLRGKSFYINAVKYVINNIESMECATESAREVIGTRTNDFIKGLLASEKNEEVRRSFVRNINKQFPVYTIETLPYLDADRVSRTLEAREGYVAGDEYTRPFIDRIIALNARVHELEELNETFYE